MQNQNVKLCKHCNIVKDLIGGFYKAGPVAYQKLCKVCHNTSRSQYPNKTHYKPVTAKGFDKIPEEIRNKIIYDHHIKINFKEIVEKYKPDYPKLKYQSLLKYKRTGKIPSYIEPTITTENNENKENII